MLSSLFVLGLSFVNSMAKRTRVYLGLEALKIGVIRVLGDIRVLRYKHLFCTF
jgi:hypothetical protein